MCQEAVLRKDLYGNGEGEGVGLGHVQRKTGERGELPHLRGPPPSVLDLRV